MVDSCFNPACRAEFKQLNGGDLYALERRSTDTEFFWLCNQCASAFDLRLDSTGEVALRRRGGRGLLSSPRPEGNLRLVNRAVRAVTRRDDAPAGQRVKAPGKRSTRGLGEWGGLAR